MPHQARRRPSPGAGSAPRLRGSAPRRRPHAARGTEAARGGHAEPLDGVQVTVVDPSHRGVGRRHRAHGFPFRAVGHPSCAVCPGTVSERAPASLRRAKASLGNAGSRSRAAAPRRISSSAASIPGSGQAEPAGRVSALTAATPADRPGGQRDAFGTEPLRQRADQRRGLTTAVPARSRAQAVEEDHGAVPRSRSAAPQHGVGRESRPILGVERPAGQSQPARTGHVRGPGGARAPGWTPAPRPQCERCEQAQRRVGVVLDSARATTRCGARARGSAAPPRGLRRPRGPRGRASAGRGRPSRRRWPAHRLRRARREHAASSAIRTVVEGQRGHRSSVPRPGVGKRGSHSWRTALLHRGATG